MATAINWPSSLPNFEAPSLSVDSGSVLIRSKMDSGYDKTRKRYTGSKTSYSGEIILDNDELAVFEDFFDNTIDYGNLSFNFPSPVYIGYPVEVKFKFDGESPLYTVNPLSGDIEWSVNFTIEKVEVGLTIPLTLISDTGDELIADDSSMLFT